MDSARQAVGDLMFPVHTGMNWCLCDDNDNLCHIPCTRVPRCKNGEDSDRQTVTIPCCSATYTLNFKAINELTKEFKSEFAGHPRQH